MIENLIYDALKGISFVSSNVAKYSNEPAVFYQQAPHDKDKLWGASMFPRIVYNVDWHFNPERKTDGAMAIVIYCNNENEVFPEDIGRNIVESLSELFLTDESGTYCLLWDRTESFDAEGNEPVVFGTAVTFDILAFPKQEGISPCPVWAANKFIKEMQPNCVLLGHDAIPTCLKATALNPIVYVKKANAENIKTTYAMAWVSEDIIISVISENINETRKWINAIVRDLQIERETIMQNGSPYLITEIKENTSDDPLRTGQIVVTGQYGIMRKQKEETKLNHATFNQ